LKWWTGERDRPKGDDAFIITLPQVEMLRSDLQNSVYRDFGFHIDLMFLLEIDSDWTIEEVANVIIDNGF